MTRLSETPLDLGEMFGNLKIPLMRRDMGKTSASSKIGLSIPGYRTFLGAVIPVLNLSKYRYYGAGFFFETMIFLKFCFIFTVLRHWFNHRAIIIIIFMPNNLSNSDFAFQLKVSLACRKNVELVYHHCHSVLHKSIQDYAELNLDS